MALYVDIKLDGMSQLADELKAKADELCVNAAHDLAVQTYGHIVEQVQEKLHSSREMYLEHLKISEEGPGKWLIKLEPEAMWIEQGMPRHEMIDDLLFGKRGQRPTMTKDGFAYKIIPIQLNKRPAEAVNPSVREIINVVKSEMRQRGIAWGKIERNPDGSPKLGTLHKLSVMDAPIKTQQGVAQGLGPIGQVRQGLTGTPFLSHVNVIQRNLQVHSGGSTSLITRRDVMSFRVVSSKQKGTGRWIYPGIEGKHFFEDAKKWADTTWDREIKPAILGQLQIPPR